MSTEQVQEKELARAASGLTEGDLEWIYAIDPKITQPEKFQGASSPSADPQKASSQEEGSEGRSGEPENTQEESGIFTGQNQDDSSAGNGSGSRKNKKRKRRKVRHRWPEVGTILEADYEGVHYEAEVVSAPRYKSGKAVKILSGPAAGKVKSSMSGAMNLATQKQRRENDLGQKGVANGWEFWKVKK